MLKDALRTVIIRFRQTLSICPSDLEPDVFVPRALRDPTTWFLSLAQFSDRSRTMETLLDTALERAPSNNKLVKVRESWIAWDRGICQGRRSSWQTGSAVPPYLTRFQSYRVPDKFNNGSLPAFRSLGCRRRGGQTARLHLPFPSFHERAVAGGRGVDGKFAART
jgi:hypothetical protein